MSALGQKQTHAVQKLMSALPQKADMCGCNLRCPLRANSRYQSISVFQWPHKRQAHSPQTGQPRHLVLQASQFGQVKRH